MVRELLLERADAAGKEMRVRMLLELIEIMEGHASNSVEENTEPTCLDYEDFFQRTRFVPEKGLISNGRIQYFSDDMVIRFLEKITVMEEGYDIEFKTGIVVEVLLKELKR